MAVEIFTKDNCMFCKKAKALFTENNIPFEEIDASTVDRFKAMQERIPGAKTVPQVIIDGHLIGGFDVLDTYKDQILAKLKKSDS